MNMPRDLYRIASQVHCHAETVRKWALGERISPSLRYAIEKACVELGIPIPQGLPVLADLDD